MSLSLLAMVHPEFDISPIPEAPKINALLLIKELFIRSTSFSVVISIIQEFYISRGSHIAE